MSMEDLKKALKEKKLVFGTERTIKNLKLGKAKAVFLAKNCPKATREDINYYSGLCKAAVHELEEPSDELALICKKNFPVTVISY